MIIPRTCTEISAGDADQHQKKESRPLEAFRDAPAYVLLGDPGAGKTIAFKTECETLGEKAYSRVITADEFLTYDASDLPSEWREKTLFIDGLDEVRAGSQGESAFREIRKLLRALGKPRFRLSCRQADWLGTNDQERLESVSPDSKVTVLRLDPLTVSDVEKFLKDRSDIPDAHTFIEIAKEKGVDGLLANPLSLDMLAKAVAGGRSWPESRKETFEMACHKIVAEHHPGHKEAQASKGPPSSEQLLDAAGRLCAVQLISGAAGYTLRDQADEKYLALDQCDSGSLEILHYARATKLFKGVSDNRFSPFHRHIAEFLGARHLAQIIERDLPARRIIALIVGEGGTVVTEMRGLSAWLAAHSKDARADLIERDPIGVGLYGDIREFSIDEKRALLKALHREGVRLRSVFLKTTPFGALATPDMEPVLEEILTDSNCIQDSQMFTEFVLDVLTKGEPLPSLSELLLKIVRDDTSWPHINTLALDAFIRNCPDSPDKTGKLKALLADIHTGRISDPDNELFGVLLIKLYPQEVPPSEVWNCLSEKGNPEFFGRYWRFWDTELTEKSSDEQVAELLDYLQQRLPVLQPALDVRDLDSLSFKLLARGLEAYGDQIDPERLCAWLDTGFSGNQDGLWLSDEEAILRKIRSWLEQHSDIQKVVFMEGLAWCSGTDEFREHASNFRKRLYGASPPSDFGLWCLKQAVAVADTKPRVAEYLLEWAVRTHTDQSGNKGLSIKVLREHTQGNETLKAYLDRLLAPPSIPPIPPELLETRKKYTEERKQQEEQWLEYVRSNEAALRENRAAPYLLHQMADRYFGNFLRFGGNSGLKAIEEKLRGNRGLIDATLKGFRSVIDREDVPDVKEILSLREKSHMHCLNLPFLAGLAELERTAEEDSSRWDDSRIRKAVAFYYCTPHGGYLPGWYQRLLVARPEIVAEVQVQSAVSEFRSGREHIYKLWELAHDPNHSQVAKYASLPLLHAFPTRCKLSQIENLNHLLWAALQYTDRSSLQELIKKKLSRKSMNDAQRVYWLAAGITVSPGTYNDLLRDFVRGREGRILHLAAFFCPQTSASFLSFGESRIAYELGIPGLELLIHLVGSYVGPDKWKEGGLVTPAQQASRLVNGLIQRLVASPTKDASDALDRLLADPALSRWRDVISQAQDAQRVTWRDASYHHHTIEQVCRTLNGGTPANAAALADLVTDHLDEIARKIRGGPTSDWRQYWHVDQYNRPTCEKPEDACRDNLLSDLQDRLKQLDIDAQPEGQYANDKRADIRVSCRDFQVPIEIKRNVHRDLWSAPRNQLIKLYTSAPDTDGYGIYLVFWFGKDRTQPPPSGTRPANAKELKKRLEATLSFDEARKISVCVIDVSRPN